MEKPVARFEFGRNWKQYLAGVSEERLRSAETHLAAFLGKESIQGRRFLDIGSGSGVHSYAAMRLGAAQVVSFDYDPNSVEATRQLKETHAAQAPWEIFRWDVLSDSPLPQPDPFDIVYSWGVLHHTGQMWKAIERSLKHVKPGGFFDIALYNKHWTTPFWKILKRLYCGSPEAIQKAWLSLYIAYEKTKNLFRSRETPRARGMDLEIDLHDWLGGYPYEAASPEEVIAFFTWHGFRLEKQQLNSGTGCSEFLFRKLDH